MAETPPLRDDPSVLERFFTVFGRPYYALMSAAGGVGGALSGGGVDALARGAEDAVRNSAMFASEIATGSWLHRQGPAYWLGDPQEGLTTREQRPEFTDVLRRSHLPVPRRGTLGETTLNVVGGVALDPLTYLTGGIGGGAKAGGRVAKGALVGLGAADDVGKAAARTAVRALRAGAPEEFAQRTARILEETFGATPRGPSLSKEAAEEAAATRWIEEAMNARDLEGTRRTRWLDAVNDYKKDPATRELAQSKAAIHPSHWTPADQLDYLRRLPNAADKIAEAERRLVAQGFDPGYAAANAEKEAALLAWTDLRPNQIEPAAGTFDVFLNSFAKERAAEAVGFDPATGLAKLTGTAGNVPLIDDAIEALTKQKILKPYGVPTIEIPFTDYWRALPGGERAWGLVGLGSPAKLFNEVVRLASPEVADALARTAKETTDKFTRTFYSKTFGLVPEVVRSVGRQIAGDTVARRSERVAEVGALFGGNGIGEEVERAMGREWLRNDDLFRKLGDFSPAEMDTLKAQVLEPFGAGETVRQGVTEAASRLLPWLDETDWSAKGAETIRLLYLRARNEVGKAAATAGGDPIKAMQVLDGYVDKLRLQTKDLVDAGVLEKNLATPFYVPHQASNDLVDFLAAASDPLKRKDGKTYASALSNVYHEYRRHGRYDEFIQAMEATAEKYGVEKPVLDETRHMAAAEEATAAREAGVAAIQSPLTKPRHTPDEVVDTRLGRLLAKRLDAHERVMGAIRLRNAVKKVYPEARHATITDAFLSAQLAPLGPRGNLVGKLLGGGQFRIGPDLVGEQGVRALERARPVLGGRPGAVSDKRGVVYDFPGFSSVFKPLLYLGGLPPAVSTIVRNAVSGAVTGLTDPEIGRSGFVGIMGLIRDLPVVRTLEKAGVERSNVGRVLQALRRPETLTAADVAALHTQKVGGHPLATLLDDARAGIVQPRSFADLELLDKADDMVTHLERIGRDGYWETFKQAITGKLSDSVAGSALEAFRAAMRPLADITTAAEDGLRLGSYLALIDKGYDRASAAAKVAEHYVDYAYNSNAERLVRDLFPFARYQIGITPIAYRGVTSPAGRAVGKLVTSPGDESPMPPEIRGQTSIPFGTDAEGNRRFVTNLGLPFESMASSLSLLGAPFGAGDLTKNVLGQAHPLLKTPAEMIAGTSFYSGQPIGERDRAPEWVPEWFPGVKTETLPSGRVVKKWPPFVAHAVLGLLPISRMNSELDKWVKAVHGDAADWINATTGVKIRTVDGEREAVKLLRRHIEEAVARGDLGVVRNYFVKGEKANADPRVVEALKQLAEAEKRQRARSR